MTLPPEVLWHPDAVRRPLPEDMGGTLARSRGLVLHVQAGNNSPYGWFARGDVKASSHWWVGKDGRLEQYVPADRQAWAQAAGNSAWHSVETEGYPGEPLTAAQIATLGRLYRWGNAHWGWPFRLAESPAGSGLGWHGMGGREWGGHPGCPGELRKAQRGAILAAARGERAEEDEMPDPREYARAVVDLIWEQMRERPAGAAEGWYPPRQPHPGALWRRDYEMTGEVLAAVRAIRQALAEVLGPDHPGAAALAPPAPVAAPPTVDELCEAVRWLDMPDAVRVAAVASARAASLMPPFTEE